MGIDVMGLAPDIRQKVIELAGDIQDTLGENPYDERYIQVVVEYILPLMDELNQLREKVSQQEQELSRADDCIATLKGN